MLTRKDSYVGGRDGLRGPPRMLRINPHFTPPSLSGCLGQRLPVYGVTRLLYCSDLVVILARTHSTSYDVMVIS